MHHEMSNRFTAVSHAFYMDVASVAQDVAIGFLIAGALAAWVPNSFWQTVFLTHDPHLGAVWGPVVAPVIALVSFVCSVGNVPLAVVLWNGGISFGGVITFIFADLVILPILDIYRKYYGWRTSLYLLGTSYAAMVAAGFAVGGIFQLLGLVPTHHFITAFQTSPSWNYTTLLDIASLGLAAVMGWRFLRTGGVDMLRAMESAPASDSGHAVDPVCGMTVDPATAAGQAHFEGKTYYFCSSGCKARFEKDPASFVHQTPGAGHEH
jgi:YHS domain-containing protein/uncharacterized membrane protein YraQ (UPF0718 family)